MYSLYYFDSIILWLENHMGSCIYKKYLGIECPGCGMQRSIIELLKGNLTESFFLFPALLPMLFTFLFLILHLIFKFKHGALVLKISFIFTVSILVTAYIIKLTT